MIPMQNEELMAQENNELQQSYLQHLQQQRTQVQQSPNQQPIHHHQQHQQHPQRHQQHHQQNHQQHPHLQHQQHQHNLQQLQQQHLQQQMLQSHLQQQQQIPQLQSIPNFPNDLSQTHHLSQQLDMLAQVKHEDLLENQATKKVAPRSSDLYRIGPQFSHTRHHQSIYCFSNNMPVSPILDARIDRGFEMGDDDVWVGYKRNYFTLVSSFTLDNFDFSRFIKHKFYTYEKMKGGDRKVEISYFAIRLVAKCSDDEVNINLVQHTPKRDKGPQFPPPIYPAVPGVLPDHATVKISSNKRNASKLENMNKIFYFDRADYYNSASLDTMKDPSILKNYPSDSIARIARFERIQFTSSIRMKSTTINNKFFTLNVELLGIIEDEDSHIQPILLSSIESPPLIIRGRSPSNYQKDKYRPIMQMPLQ